MDELIKTCKKYFKILSNKKNPKISWGKGYYWSKNKNLNELERYFVKKMPAYSKILLSYLDKNINSADAIYIVSLLGWSNVNQGKFVKLSKKILLNKNHNLHNYFFRAIFPILVTKKSKINIDILIELSKHRNPYCKNKAFGIIAFSTLSLNEIQKLKSHKNYIKKCAKSSKKVVSKPAQLVLNKLDL